MDGDDRMVGEVVVIATDHVTCLRQMLSMLMLTSYFEILTKTRYLIFFF